MRELFDTPDVRLAEMARGRYGVVSVAELAALGLDKDAVARRVRNGRLHLIHRGVYAVGHRRLTREGAWLAAVLACGPQAALSHRSAGALWGLRASDAIDVVVPTTAGRRGPVGVGLHRSRRPVEATARAGIPVTTPGRTLADLATALPRRALERAVEMVEALRLDVRVDPGHPGAARLRAAMAHDLGTTTRSALEDAFLDLCERHRIPRPRVNARVAGLEVDFCWPEARLVVEVDGYEHHGTRAAFERDRARDARLAAAGWRTLRFSYVQVFEQPETVVGAILSARSRSPATRGSPSP